MVSELQLSNWSLIEETRSLIPHIPRQARRKPNRVELKRDFAQRARVHAHVSTPPFNSFPAYGSQ